MKNFVKWFGIIALVAVIGFSFVSCGGGGGGSDAGSNGNVTYTYSDDGGNAYKLEITQQANRAAYNPKKGDSYVLTINFTDGKVEKSTGTVKEFKDGQLQLKSSDDKEFQVMVKGDKIAGIAGDDLPVKLPEAKRVTITGFTTWQGKTANNGGDYYHRFGVFLIADPDDMYDSWFPRVNALWYETVQSNGSAGNVNFDLIIPVDNTWNYGRMPWTGTGDYYVVIVPVVSPYFYSDEAKIYANGTSPIKVSINNQTTTLAFNKFIDM